MNRIDVRTLRYRRCDPSDDIMINIDCEGCPDGEQFPTVEAALKYIDGLEGLDTLREFDMTHLFLPEFPDIIKKMKGLTSLNISRNEIKEIPLYLCELTDLEYLDLSYNQIERVPNCIGNLTRLELFDLDGNRLIELPATIGDLRTLNLSILMETILKSYQILWDNYHN